MLKVYTQKFESLYRPHNLTGAFMPSADKAERLISTFPKRTEQVAIRYRGFSGTYRDDRM